MSAWHASNKDLYLYQGNGQGGFKPGTGTVVSNNWSAFNIIF